MKLQEGRVVPDTEDEIMDVLMNNARNVFGENLNDDEQAVIKIFYTPIARMLADLQNDLRTVLDSTQLDYAEGFALDLLTALIGVKRKDATKSTGEATFSRETAASVNYTIPKGTVIQTDSVDPTRFVTTEVASLPAGQVSVSGVPIEAQEAGVDGNVGANTLKIMTNPPTGIEEVINPSQTGGGKNSETDDELRERAKRELSEGMRGTSRAIRNQLLKMEDVNSVSLFINDTESTDADGIPPHHTECVVEGGLDQEVGQTIFDTKGAGDGTHGGARGSPVTVEAEIGNGQTHPVSFSRPNVVQIYIDIELKTNAEYQGDEKVKDSIVNYIGGTTTTGNTTGGDLRTGDDVIYSKIIYRIMKISGIEDVTSLNFGKTNPPTGGYVQINDTEIATTSSIDGSITITEV